MKRLCLLLILTAGCFLTAISQKITYSENIRRDNRDMNFEILGKFGTHYLIYKNITREHYITKYDAEMKIVDNVHHDYIPDRTFNVDFITYPDYSYMIYQYQRAAIVYCYAVKLDAGGNKTTEPRLLDTTRIGFFAENAIYNTTFSEDRKKILIHKRNVKNEYITIVTKLFDADLQMLDSTRQYLRYDDRKEVYGNIQVDNEGGIVYPKELRRSSWDNSSNLVILSRKPGAVDFRQDTISLEKKYIEDVAIKVDNLNRRYIVNSFYFESRRGNVAGLFTAMVDMEPNRPLRRAFNVFSDSMRIRMNSQESYKFVFDNLVARNIVVKKSGGFIIAAEDFFSETLNMNNMWNRNFMWNTFPYTNANDYFMWNPQFNNNRYWNNNWNRNINTRFYYDDILIASIDSSLKLEWNNIIHKKQYDVETDNFLSYGVVNTGGELHFLFIDKNSQKQIVSNHSITPSGEMKRYPTLRSNERGFEFMPRLAKQVGANQLIMPFFYLNKAGFAKIDF